MKCHVMQRVIYRQNKELIFFPALGQIVLLFFTSLIMSVVQYCDTLYKCISTTLRSKLLHQIKSAQRL